MKKREASHVSGSTLTPCGSSIGRPNRVLFCTQTAHTGGGVEEWMFSLVGILEDHGWDVTVGLARGREFHNPSRFLNEYAYRKTAILPAPRGLREERYLSLVHAFRQHQPDVIVPVQLADALYAACKWKCQTSRRPRIVTCLHGRSEDVLSDFRSCAASIDLAVSVSKGGAALLRKSCAMPEERVRHIPTGVPPARRAKQPGSVLRLGYVGRLEHEEKRIRDIVALLHTLAATEAFECHIYGDGPERTFLENALCAHIASGRAVIHGAVSRSALYDSVYPALDVLLIFSKAEGGPIVAWEAMAHGVVPVVSDFAWRKEEGILRHEENCLVFPIADVAQAAACIRRLHDTGLRGRLSRAARRLPYPYSDGGFAKEWSTAFEDVMTRPPRIDREQERLKMVSPGRLPNIGGERSAYWARVLSAKSFKHAGPGGEWPHAYGGL